MALLATASTPLPVQVTGVPDPAFPLSPEWMTTILTGVAGVATARRWYRRLQGDVRRRRIGLVAVWKLIRAFRLRDPAAGGGRVASVTRYDD